MSVASKNPFALLNDVEDESSKEAAKAKQAGVEVPKPNRKPATTRGGRYYQRGAPKPATTTIPTSVDPTSPTGDKGERRPPRGDRGDRGYRGERGGRGGRRGGGGGGRGYDRDARLDRHSATGITDSQKKVHQGWGGDRGDTEYKDETQGANDAAGDAWGASGDAGGGGGSGWDAPAPADGAADDPWAAPTGDAAAEGGDKAPAAGDDEGKRKKKYEEEEEDNTMTLDQYRAKNAGVDSEAIPKLELRQATEGSSEYFKGAKQLVKDVDANNYFVGKQPKSNAPRTRKEGKQYIEIEARFDPPSRGGRGRGRGDRGGDRGDRGGYRGERRGGRGGGRGGGGYQQSAEVNVDDPNAFPSL